MVRNIEIGCLWDAAVSEPWCGMICRSALASIMSSGARRPSVLPACRRFHCGLHFRTYAAERQFNAYVRSDDKNTPFLALAVAYWS